MKKLKIFLMTLIVFLLVGTVNVHAEEETGVENSTENGIEVVKLEDDWIYDGGLSFTDKDLIYDLNGYNLEISGNLVVKKNITFRDSSTDKKGTLKLSAGYINVSGGTFTLESGNVELTSGGLYVHDSGIFNMTGGKLELKTSFISIYANGTFTLEKGNVELTSGALYVQSSSTFNLNGGNVELKKQYMYVNTNGTFNMNGGQLDIDNSFLKVDSGTVNANGGKINLQVHGQIVVQNSSTLTIDGTKIVQKGTYRSTIIQSNSTLNVKSGSLDSNAVAIYNSEFTMSGGNLNLESSVILNNSTFDMTGGTVEISDKGSIEVGSGSTFTLNGGAVKSDVYYGVYCYDGGKAVVKKGSITSKFSALSGNNKTGAMYFEMSGGTLTTTSNDAPAIYMPGLVSLNISGGEINGGIGVRMGEINITGGVINAHTGKTGSFDTMYAWSGAASLPDAIWVLGGTYSSNVSGSANDLVINIKGGTINCENENGSALAIYNLGSVEQKMTVNIFSSAKLKTTSTTRKAYQEFTYNDLTVDSPKTSYNTYKNTVTWNVDESLNSYTVVGGNGSITVKESELTEQTTTETITEEKVDKEDVVKVNDAAKEISDSATVAAYFDINLYKSYNDTLVGDKIKEPGKEFTITVDVPKNLDTVQEGYIRKYYIIRIHGDQVDKLDVTDNGNGTISFNTDRFSTYALVYEDVEKSVEITEPSNNDDSSKKEENTVVKPTTETSTSENDVEVPKTYDNGIANMILGLLSLISLSVFGIKLKKENN